MELLLKFHSSDSGLKMKAEFHKIFKLFEELEEAGESATLTISAKGGTSTIKLQLESPPSPPSTGTTSATLSPATGRRRRHRGAAARARRRQRAADHQASKLAAPSSASPPASGEASAPTGSTQRCPLLILTSPSHTSGRRRVMSLGRPPLPSLGSLNLDGPPPSPPPPSSPPTASPPPSSPPPPTARAAEKEQQDQLHAIYQMLKESAHQDELARQACHQAIADWKPSWLP